MKTIEQRMQENGFRIEGTTLYWNILHGISADTEKWMRCETFNTHEQALAAVNYKMLLANQF